MSNIALVLEQHRTLSNENHSFVVHSLSYENSPVYCVYQRVFESQYPTNYMLHGYIIYFFWNFVLWSLDYRVIVWINEWLTASLSNSQLQTELVVDIIIFLLVINVASCCHIPWSFGCLPK
jgi:hypothetical protein